MLRRLYGCFRGDRPTEHSAPVEPPHAIDDALLEPAMTAIRQGRSDDAIVLLEALLEAHPGCAKAHLLAGTCRHEQKQIEDARDHYLLAATLEPAWWAPHFHLGVLDCDSGRHAESTTPFLRALELGAPQPRVHDALGAAYLNIGSVAEAMEQFRKALAVAPDFAQAHSNLGLVLLGHLERYDEGTRHLERAVALAPADPAVLCNWVMALHHWGRWDEALVLADALLARDPTLVEARINRALALLGKGDFSGAWDDYEARKLLPGNAYATGPTCPEWQGQPLDGHSIFVYPEQGLGDEIMFASCLPQLVASGARCTVECHPKLEKLFRRSFREVEVVAADPSRRWPQRPQRVWDFKVSIGSLPRFLRRTRAEFPEHSGYLRADPARVAHWKAKLSELPGRLKVGVSWRGGLASTRRGLRSIPLELWLPVMTLPGIEFVSLQYSDPECEIEALRRSGRRGPQHWSAAIDDYDETAALIGALDLVISVQTAVVHLAGALGKEVWALIPTVPEWRYGGEGTSMAWYPDARLFRQSERGVWTDVLEKVRGDLQEAARRRAQVT